MAPSSVSGLGMHDGPYKVASGKNLWLVKSFYRTTSRTPLVGALIYTDRYDAETGMLAASDLVESMNRMAGPEDDRPDVRHARCFDRAQDLRST
jgi:hypothetical protein